jgi:glycosyltransferase involved in cell wall biosynthesis
LVRILFAINTLARGGAERQLVELAKGLDPTRFAASVACVIEGGPLARELGARQIPVTIFDARGLGGLVTFVQHIRRLAPDIVHSFLFGSNVIASIGATIAGVPIVITSRRSLGFFKDGRPHYDLLQQVANRFTDIVVANAEAVRVDTIEREGLQPRRVRVIRNGVDLARFANPSDTTATRAALHGRGREGPLVVVVANLIPYKGLEYFLEAWRTVVREMPNAWAVVVGEGPARSNLEGHSADVAGSLRFVGSRDDIPAILAASDLVVQSSLYEGFPNAVLEAMAAGRPVVATSVGGTVEAVAHERTGLLVPPRDSAALAHAMLRVLSDNAAAKRFGRAGRERIENEFSVSRMVAQYEDLYTSLSVTV